MTGFAIFFALKTAFAAQVTREQLSELHQIRTEIKIAVFDKTRYQQDILKSQMDLETQKAEVGKNLKDADELKEKILERVDVLYKIRRAYPEGSWLAHAKEEDFSRKNYYLNYLNNQDRKLAEEYKKKSESIVMMKKNVEAYVKRLLALKSEAEAKYEALRAREARQRELVRQIRSVINPLDANQNEKAFFSELQGKLDQPLMGTVSGNLGLQTEQSSKLRVLRTGILIQPGKSKDVRSIYDGEILHVGEIEGWGPVIVVDHGESYYSVYGHLKNLSVRPGDRVLAQQKLAEVSSLPYHDHYNGHGLYFEIRHYSEPEDPKLWFKGAQNESSETQK